MRSILLSIGLIVASAAIARAGTRYELILNPAGGTLASSGCKLDKPTRTGGSDDELVVTSSNTLPAGLELHVGSGASMVVRALGDNPATTVRGAIEAQPIAIWDPRIGK